MGSFLQHVTCSTLTGVALGGAASAFGFPLPVCCVSAGLCSVAGMLPDIDSDTSKSFQECIYLAAGLGAVLLVQRMKTLNESYTAANSGQIDSDVIIICAAGMFLFIRFGIGSLVKRLTVHRGMFHSIPAAVLCGELVYLSAAGTQEERLLKGAALTAGYLSHLILDEVYSIDSTGRVFKPFRLKKSFGTALKWSDPKRKFGTFMLYAAVCPLTCALMNETKTVNLPETGVRIEETAGNFTGSITSNTKGAEVIAPALSSGVRRDNEMSVFSAPTPQQAAPDNYIPPLPQELSPLMPVGSEFVPPLPKTSPAPIFLQ